MIHKKAEAVLTGCTRLQNQPKNILHCTQPGKDNMVHQQKYKTNVWFENYSFLAANTQRHGIIDTLLRSITTLD